LLNNSPTHKAFTPVTPKPESDIALEATHLIQRMVRHILYDNCDHCRHILKDNNTAGNHPAAKPDSTPIPAQIPTEQRSDIK
jgi:hypothetical protein